MHETEVPIEGESEAIREWIAQYEPRLLSAAQREHLLPELRKLILAAEFATLGYARAAMSRAVRFVADTAAPEVTDLDQVLTELNLAAWSHGGMGRAAPPAPQDVSSIRRLLRLRHGLDREVRGAAQTPVARPAFSPDELEVLARVASKRDSDIRMLVAVVGAGVWGPETSSAVIRVVDGVPCVVLSEGARRDVDPDLVRLFPEAPEGRVCMDGWHNLTRRAARRGVKLTQYRARDAWAVRVLKEPRPAVEVIRGLGFHRDTIAAVALLLELPHPDELRGMLRGQRHGDWRPGTSHHVQPQFATSEADLEVNRLSSRRPSRAEVKRSVQAARSTANSDPPLEAKLARILEAYEPESCDDEEWNAIRPFAHAVMRRCGIQSAGPFRTNLSIVVTYLRWRRAEGLDLQPSASMTYAAIDDFYRRVGDIYEQTSRNDFRSRLRRVARAVNPGADAPPIISLGHRPVRAGYSQAEEAAIQRVALRQRSASIRRQLCLIVGLALGAGLASRDLRHLRTQHLIDEGASGIRVEVPGAKPRTVWVRIEYEELVRVGLSGVQSGHLLIGKKVDRKKVTGTVVEQADLYDFSDLDVARMRTTWLSWLLTQPVPLAVVLYAAGLDSARTLTDLAQQLPVNGYGAEVLRGEAT